MPASMSSRFTPMYFSVSVVDSWPRNGDRLDRNLGMEETAAEGPPESMVGEMEPQALAEGLDDHFVEGAGVLPVRPSLRFVLVVAPEDQVAWVDPVRVVRPDRFYNGATLIHPPGENIFGQVVEPDGPVLSVPAALPADVDVRFGSSVVDVVQYESADLHVPEAHAELQVDHDVLQRGLGSSYEGVVLVILQSVCVHPHVLGEHYLHALWDIILVEQEVALQVAELALLVGDLVPGPTLGEEKVDRFRIDLVRGGIEASGLEEPLRPVEAPFALLTGVLLGVDELGLDELPDAAVRCADILGYGITRTPPRRGIWTPARRRMTVTRGSGRSRPCGGSSWGTRGGCWLCSKCLSGGRTGGRGSSERVRPCGRSDVGRVSPPLNQFGQSQLISPSRHTRGPWHGSDLACYACMFTSSVM